MSIPVTPFMWLTAFLPILLLLVLMIGFHWGATDAAPIGVAAAVVTGVLLYKADLGLIAIESAKGIWNALVILLIVWTAVLLYQVGNEANAFLAIRNGMKRLLPNELLLLLALGWIFESFLQGITGFGVPVAVGAPLLIGIGVKPLWAVIIPLLGQSWGNTYGTLGAAWDALAMSAGLSAGEAEYFLTALYAAALLWLWNLLIGLVTCWFYGRGRAVKKGFPAVLLLSGIQGGGELVLSQFNPTLACFVPACVSLAAILLLGKSSLYGTKWRIEDSAVMKRESQKDTGKEAPQTTDMTFLHALLPYVLLSVITLAVLLITPVRQLLSRVSIGPSFPKTVTGYGFVNEASDYFSPLSPFTHASMFLFVSSMAGLAFYTKRGWIAPGGVERVFKKSLFMTLPSGIAVIGLVIMSKIMAGTGQTAVLADGIARVLGKGYVFLAPFIGMLGSFMTGSNMSSNILFGSFQMTTAGILRVRFACVLASQTAGGSIGSAISPSNIVLGTTTADILGREGEVLKRMSAVVLPTAFAMGIVVFFCI